MAKRVNVRFRTRTSTFFFWLMTLAGLALVFMVATLPALSRNRVLNQELKRLEEENGRLRLRLGHLRLEGQALHTDPVYNEALARRELGLVKPGERVFWTPPSSLRRSSDSLLNPTSAARPGRNTEATAAPSWLARLGGPGRYLTGALHRLSTDTAARKDGVLLAMAMLTAAFLLFGQKERTRGLRKSPSLARKRA